MLLLMRHLESTKNTCKQFSSVDNCEGLTSNGQVNGYNIAVSIENFVKTHNYTVNKIYCANSTRALETAKIIADRLEVGICAFNELLSNNSGVLRGKSETEACEMNPAFIKQLQLYRAGIFSSYDFVQVINREDKHCFEKRVNNCLDKILNNDPSTLKIVVLHHSSLTAVIIKYARKFYNYPKTHYGHVACELGNMYLISDEEIILCNTPASELRL